MRKVALVSVLFAVAGVLTLASFGALSSLWSGHADSPTSVYVVIGATELALAAIAAIGAVLILGARSDAGEDRSVGRRWGGGAGMLAAYVGVWLVTLPISWLEGEKLSTSLPFALIWVVLVVGLYLRLVIVWIFLMLSTTVGIFGIWAVQPEGVLDTPVILWTGVWFIQLGFLLSPGMRAYVLRRSPKGVDG